ncbi:hypothetical protein [Rhizobium sp. RU36D]|uniref:hypothetical protein n=1 Tax=Rhizobium sp. RU36D TaxID=1907415 RepID=UPI0009FF40B6|nr:hypothetical protein [Rhizobium sp. RU36D]
MTIHQADAPDHAPLLSNRFLARLVAVVAVLALLSGAINLLGHWYGDALLGQGETDSSHVHTVTIGQDQLKLTANTLRFDNQRMDGALERADLYLLWPEMIGYRKEYRRRFEDVSLAGSLIFIQLTQSTMSRDMSGRLEPIYRHLFSGPPEKGPYGLTLHRLKAESGYGNEVLLTARRLGERDYVVRCVLPEHGAAPSSGDCQRDIHVGKDLTVLYRFSSANLADWDKIDMSIRAYIEQRLIASEPIALAR